ncbi:MAG: hypothetical protein M1827_004601 [Pycnora praestabilis]|nr:MAG: hypothetical protein M1827_004601 [Pycnora praestabilis]
MRASSRPRTYPPSPAKRPLSDLKDNGNATSPSPAGSGTGEENRTTRSASPAEKHQLERESRGLGLGSLDSGLAANHTLARLDKGTGGNLAVPTTSSPLKRSDGIMNLDQASLGSPVAKRRSLHGASFGSDFNIFEQEGPQSETHLDEDDNSDSDLPASPHNPAASGLSSYFAAMPKRSSSLRKSTLQQRHNEKPTFARSRPNMDLALEFATPGHAASKSRHRVSLENFLPPMVRDSPFSSQGTLPNASVHVLSQHGNGSQNTCSQPQHHPHPLSRTMTQSSSSSSIADESPTHAPIHPTDQPRPTINFSKSLPVGAPRPFLQDAGSRGGSSQTSSESSFATPQNYKLARPLPAAFMSTGLISKRNRNADDQQLGSVGHKTLMPDTPCKRPSNTFAPAPVHVAASAIVKARQTRHEFGTPSTPFNPHATRPTSGTFGKGVSVFGSNFASNGIVRRGSFVSNDGEENSQSPSARGDSQSSTECELPPTPTKQALVTGTNGSANTTRSSLFSSTDMIDSASATTRPNLGQKEQSCKSSPFGIQSGNVLGDDDIVMKELPSAQFRLESSQDSTPSLSQSRLLRKSQRGSPTPMSKKSLSISSFPGPRKSMNTKTSPLSIASPLEISGFTEQLSPCTPLDGMLPPDPSCLSISGYGDGQAAQLAHRGSFSASSFPPATPTTPRDYFPQIRNRRTSITPIHGFAKSDVDASLASRFDKAELIGTGEFSQVYRVTQPQESTLQPCFPARTSPQAAMPESVWAVKRSRQAYAGARDRQRKLQEVNILKSLGQADHVVHLIDSWEDKNHLYIQTEFCEEGSLDMFLSQVGRKARLDDFRIWKIMLELSQGLKHIHDSGFIHLDLKPANVLITFEGVLKIADFGMATSWPAPAGIEGEGDREYIGPEILKGQFDKPADIFALGIIMVEIAGNVELPDNGVSWQKLRTGDLSDVPSLTWSSQSNIFRDSSGNPLSQDESSEMMYGSDLGDDDLGSLNFLHARAHRDRKDSKPSNLQLSRRGELLEAPSFMTDPSNHEALDCLVHWMISPQPQDRPVIDQVLRSGGVQWANMRRRAGATVFEGNWGPADDVLADDAEMIDV